MQRQLRSLRRRSRHHPKRRCSGCGSWVLVQRVLPPNGGDESWSVLDDAFGPIEAFLAHLTVVERSPTTVRSDTFDLRDFLEFHQIEWATVTQADLERLVTWLRLPPDTRASRVTELAAENKQLRHQLALAHGQLRSDRVSLSRTPSTTRIPTSDHQGRQ